MFARLPVNHANVSGFCYLEPADMAKYGVLPVVDVTPAFDPATHRKAGASYTVGVDRVLVCYEVMPNG